MRTLDHLVHGCKAYNVDLALLNGIVQQGGRLQRITSSGRSVTVVLCSVVQDAVEINDEFFCIIREMDAHTVGSIFWTKGFAPFAVQKLIEKVYDDGCGNLGLPAVKYWCLGNQLNVGPFQSMPEIPMYVHILHACFLVGRSNNITDQELNLLLGCTQSVVQSSVFKNILASKTSLDQASVNQSKACSSWNKQMQDTLEAAVTMKDDSPHSIVALGLRAPEIVAQCRKRLVVWNGVSLISIESSDAGLSRVPVSLTQFKHYVTKVLGLATDEQYIAILCQTRSKKHGRKRGYCIMLYDTDKAAVVRAMESPKLTSVLHSGTREASLSVYVNGNFVTAGVCKNKDIILLTTNTESFQEQTMLIQAPWIVSASLVHNGDLLIGSKSANALAKMELNTIMISGPSYEWKTLSLSHGGACAGLHWLSDGTSLAVFGRGDSVWIDVIEMETFQKQHTIEAEGNATAVLISSANDRDFLVSLNASSSLCCSLPEYPVNRADVATFTSQEAFWYCRDSPLMLTLQQLPCEKPLDCQLYAWKQSRVELEAGLLSELSQKMSAAPIVPVLMGIPAGRKSNVISKSFEKILEKMEECFFMWSCKDLKLNTDEILERFAGWLMFQSETTPIRIKKTICDLIRNPEDWGIFWKRARKKFLEKIRDAVRPSELYTDKTIRIRFSKYTSGKVLEQLRNNPDQEDWERLINTSLNFYVAAFKIYKTYRLYLLARDEEPDSPRKRPTRGIEDASELEPDSQYTRPNEEANTTETNENANEAQSMDEDVLVHEPSTNEEALEAQTFDPTNIEAFQQHVNDIASLMEALDPELQGNQELENPSDSNLLSLLLSIKSTIKKQSDVPDEISESGNVEPEVRAELAIKALVALKDVDEQQAQLLKGTIALLSIMPQ